MAARPFQVFRLASRGSYGPCRGNGVCLRAPVQEAQLALIAIGEPAIEPLGRFLKGPPALHPQPRMLAAEALGAIGGPRAVQALVTTLLAGDFPALPLTLRLSEEAVRNCVARELGRLGDTGVVSALLQALERFHLIEAGWALARFGDARAIPALVDCLDDSFLRARASSVIEEFGRTAAAELIEALRRSVASDGVEARWSADRRAECARLLGELGNTRAEPVLLASLGDSVVEVRCAAAIALSRLASTAAFPRRIEVLIDAFWSSDLTMVDAATEAFIGMPKNVRPALGEALTTAAVFAAIEREHAPSPALRAIGRTLKRLSCEGGRALAALARHQNPLMRCVAIAYLAPMRGVPVVSTIRRALRDPDARVRRTGATVWTNLRGGREDDA